MKKRADAFELVWLLTTTNESVNVDGQKHAMILFIVHLLVPNEFISYLSC